MSLAILDLGFGNVESVRLAFARLGAEPTLIRDAASCAAAERLVLPGVGAARYAMERLAEHELIEPIRARTKPTMGICLGMQLFFEQSEEGDVEMLGLVDGRVRAIEPAPGRPVPHMGWSRIERAEPDIGLTNGDYCYFAHSFACEDGASTAALADYGGAIPAALRLGHLWGAQFHPERSSAPGSAFLAAFLAS